MLERLFVVFHHSKNIPRSLSKVGYAGWTAEADAGSVTSYPTFARRQTFITLLIRMRLMFIVRRTKVIINIKSFKNGDKILVLVLCLSIWMSHWYHPATVVIICKIKVNPAYTSCDPLWIRALSLVEIYLSKKKFFTRFALQSGCWNSNQWEELNL